MLKIIWNAYASSLQNSCFLEKEGSTKMRTQLFPLDDSMGRKRETGQRRREEGGS